MAACCCLTGAGVIVYANKKRKGSQPEPNGKQVRVQGWAVVQRFAQHLDWLHRLVCLPLVLPLLCQARYAGLQLCQLISVPAYLRFCPLPLCSGRCTQLPLCLLIPVPPPCVQGEMFSANPAFADEEGTPELREGKRSKSGRQVGVHAVCEMPAVCGCTALPTCTAIRPMQSRWLASVLLLNKSCVSGTQCSLLL